VGRHRLDGGFEGDKAGFCFGFNQAQVSGRRRHGQEQWRQLDCVRRAITLGGPVWARRPPARSASEDSKGNIELGYQGFWAELKDQIKRPVEMAFEFNQGFWIRKRKIQILLN
jgi:hypothetical protein